MILVLRRAHFERWCLSSSAPGVADHKRLAGRLSLECLLAALPSSVSSFLVDSVRLYGPQWRGGVGFGSTMKWIATRWGTS